MDRTINEAREAGYVETLAGRRRYFPDLNSGNQNIRGNAERAAINTPIQGSAADMIKLAMIRIDALLRETPYQTKMLLQVHDELVFDLALDEQEELVPKILHIMQDRPASPTRRPRGSRTRHRPQLARRPLRGWEVSSHHFVKRCDTSHSIQITLG
jgi:DNA polymerase I